MDSQAYPHLPFLLFRQSHHIYILPELTSNHIHLPRTYTQIRNGQDSAGSGGRHLGRTRTEGTDGRSCHLHCTRRGHFHVMNDILYCAREASERASETEMVALKRVSNMIQDKHDICNSPRAHAPPCHARNMRPLDGRKSSSRRPKATRESGGSPRPSEACLLLVARLWEYRPRDNVWGFGS